jgi:hypothetical protein
VVAGGEQQRHSDRVVSYDVGEVWRPVLEIADPYVDLRREAAHFAGDRFDNGPEARVGAAVRNQDERRI